MKRNTLLAILGATLVGTVIGWAAAAATYQKTGVVKEVSADTFTLDLGKEEWRFYTDGSTQGKEAVKAGQKVTVTYKQLATKIEAKK
jgi:hypothetical protein